MSILIKGMEMPKNCMDCPMNYDSIDCVLVFDISLRDKDNEFMYEDKRHPKCPLIELPSHGRLIDADALMKQIEHDTPLSTVFEKTMRWYLHNAPAIIETEE